MEAEAACAALVGQRALERRLSDVLLVAKAELPASDHAVLNLDLGVVDEVTRFAPPTLDRHARLAALVAIERGNTESSSCS